MARRGKRNKINAWAIKITVVSFVLSTLISFLSEMTADANSLTVTMLLLAFLIFASITFDGIGVAATSCTSSDFDENLSRNEYGARTARRLVENNEKVSNVCNDVVGDTFGIISGACSVAIVLKITSMLPSGSQKLLSIAVSAVISALTIGGKAMLKESAITNSKDFVFFVAKLLAVFDKEERKIKRSVVIKTLNQRKNTNALGQILNRKTKSSVENVLGKSDTERQSRGRRKNRDETVP